MGTLRRKQPRRDDIWQLDQVVISIASKNHWLWRAVDQDGYVLDEIVPNRRNTKAAKRLLMRLLKKQGVAAKRMITDKLQLAYVRQDNRCTLGEVCSAMIFPFDASATISFRSFNSGQSCS